MNLQQRRELRSGEYVMRRGADNEAERADCKRVLRNNGCRSVRFETRREYSMETAEWVTMLTAHGYMAAMHGVDGVELL